MPERRGSLRAVLRTAAVAIPRRARTVPLAAVGGGVGGCRFPNDGERSLAGHPTSGVVLLVALSDWAPGGGGTAMIPGSHVWVSPGV